MIRKRISRVLRFCAAVTAAAVLTAACAGPAAAKYASMVVDAHSGRILHAVNADTRNYPASLTKMMTVYMIFDALKRGQITPATRWKVSRTAARQPASKLDLKTGSVISVNDAVLALVTKSANDVATVVAEGLSGSEQRFALAMTARARQLGMHNTTFRNASGLPNRGQMSTARDMAQLARALLRNHPDYFHYFSTPSWRHAGRTYKNHNKLLANYEGADGIKTGYINASGFNLVASVKRNGVRLIGVVFGGRSSKSRDRHMRKLLDKGFAMAAGGMSAGAGTLAAAPPKVQPAPPRLVSEKTTWGIQVGAFNTIGNARHAAEKSKGLLPAVLGDGTVRVVPLQRKSGGLFYRARIHNIEKGAAYRACKLLERRGMQCLEVRVKEPVQVAESPG
ncbi:MAG: serine hydrolase [Rhodospirillales bacterium]